MLRCLDECESEPTNKLHWLQICTSKEEEDLARAMALSLGGAETSNNQEGKDEAGVPKTGEFRYGLDYPKPIIQPVSLMNTEEAEEEARRHQSRRDSQIAASKRQKGSAGQSFRKPHWEHSRQEWPAETPTGAISNGAKRSDGYANGSERSGPSGRTWNRSKNHSGEMESTGRRWGNRAAGG